ncbi:hypothetical protein CFN78_09920 [Amycolatopsis antarctica]|uniref:Uncharacterized protein n=1 Tax=Amycolatopsis antarctica TaxID=1854586 RepID=A0A263D3X7_9PSEU|nr:hypothetical protein [Amycolatopsis antarctica]OZM73184.1 hypothetical protein CFN78_09920 [Amycolatopsis antarctica]
MPRSQQITYRATEEKRGMTLGELEAALADARNCGAHDGDRVKVRINFGGTLKNVTVLSEDGATG